MNTNIKSIDKKLQKVTGSFTYLSINYECNFLITSTLDQWCTVLEIFRTCALSKRFESSLTYIFRSNMRYYYIPTKKKYKRSYGERRKRYCRLNMIFHHWLSWSSPLIIYSSLLKYLWYFNNELYRNLHIVLEKTRNYEGSIVCI